MNAIDYLIIHLVLYQHNEESKTLAPEKCKERYQGFSWFPLFHFMFLFLPALCTSLTFVFVLTGMYLASSHRTLAWEEQYRLQTLFFPHRCQKFISMQCVLGCGWQRGKDPRQSWVIPIFWCNNTWPQYS